MPVLWPLVDFKLSYHQNVCFSIYHAFYRILFFLCLLLDWSSFLLDVIYCCPAPWEVAFTSWICTLAFKNFQLINTSLFLNTISNLEWLFKIIFPILFYYDCLLFKFHRHPNDSLLVFSQHSLLTQICPDVYQFLYLLLVDTHRPLWVQFLVTWSISSSSAFNMRLRAVTSLSLMLKQLLCMILGSNAPFAWTKARFPVPS